MTAKREWSEVGMSVKKTTGQNEIYHETVRVFFLKQGSQFQNY
jgi:hypothetical protein